MMCNNGNLCTNPFCPDHSPCDLWEGNNTVSFGSFESKVIHSELKPEGLEVSEADKRDAIARTNAYRATWGMEPIESDESWEASEALLLQAARRLFD